MPQAVLHNGIVYTYYPTSLFSINFLRSKWSPDQELLQRLLNLPSTPSQKQLEHQQMYRFRRRVRAFLAEVPC